MTIARTFLSALALLAAPSAAFAACPTVALPTLGAGANFLEIEGPVSLIDTVDSEITVFGTCVDLPAGMLIDTSGDGVGDITLDELVNTGNSSAIGGTAIITATVSADISGNMVITADTVYYDKGEHVVVGPLISVDALAGTFNVAGTTFTMNTDTRFPSVLVDLGGNAITVDDMVGWEGTLVAGEGYEEGGVLQGRVVETEVVTTVPGVDTVIIERAQYRASSTELRTNGIVTYIAGTTNVTSTVSLDVNCDGIDLITLTVSPDPAVGGGSWTYRDRTVASTPSSVCVTSPNGGTANRTVDVR